MSLLLLYRSGSAPAGISRRALYWDGYIIREVTDALIGTGKKPIVLLNGNLRERSTTEGIPVVVVGGYLKCFDGVTDILIL